jgi:hypothetical protein
LLLIFAKNSQRKQQNGGTVLARRFSPQWDLKGAEGLPRQQHLVPLLKQVIHKVYLQEKNGKILVMGKNNSGIRKSNPRKELLDRDLIRRALWECLKKGDFKGFVEVITIYFEAATRFSKKRK